MKFRNLHKWSNLDASSSILFFAQRAEELLFDYTLDTFKPSSLNAPFLCIEAINVCADVQKETINAKNIEHVLEELDWSLKADPVSRALLDLPLEMYLPNEHDLKVLSKAMAKLSIMGRTLCPPRYLEKCEELLKKAIIADEKKQIETLARLFFTTLINMGYHKSHLYHATVQFFFTGNKPARINGVESIVDYFKIFPCLGHDFELIFMVSDLLGTIEASTKAFKIKILDSIPDKLKALAIQKEFQNETGEVIVQAGPLRAMDRYTAREKAELQLEKIRDLFTLYHHKEQIAWRDQALAIQCCEDDPFLVGLPSSAMMKGEDSRPQIASSHLNNLLNTLALEPESFRKFFRAADFHGLGVSNRDPENQLLSLWIALETIVPTSASCNKIDSIISGIVPFLTMNYLGKIFRSLSRDLIFWNRHITHKFLKKINAPTSSSFVRKVFLLVVLPENEEIRKELYIELKDFHLLRNRIFSLSKNLSSEDKISDVLKNHEKKVSWQIRRLYRTRNIIVHSGRTPQNIKILIENAHSYLDEILLSIVRMSASSYQVRSIGQAFDLAGVAKNKIFHHLNKNGNFDALNVGVIIGEHDFIKISPDSAENKDD